MPPPEPRTPRRAAPREPARTPSAAEAQRGATGRQRPAPNSALAPSPTPLMPVPDPDRSDHRSGAGDAHPDRVRGARDRGAGDRAGRRQHHRRGDGAATHSEELVYLSGRVPRALRDELHIRAIHEGRPLVELLRDAIGQYLENNHPDSSHR